MNKVVTQRIITEDSKSVLFKEHLRNSNLCIISKICKKDNPGRPIINSIGILTETLYAYVDEIWRFYAKQAHRYVKDMGHFPQIIKDLEVQPQHLICTINVSS